MVNLIPTDGDLGTEGGFGILEYAESVTTPTIIQGDEQIQPFHVEEMTGTSKGNSTQHRDLCGNTEVERNGDDNWHVTIQGHVLKRQLDDLKAMRPADESVRVVSDGFTGNVVFDRFTWTQSAELNTAVAEIEGRELEEPIFEFQLQSRAENNE